MIKKEGVFNLDIEEVGEREEENPDHEQLIPDEGCVSSN